MNPTQLAGLLGFLFVATWIVLGFGDAVLCLIGALSFYLATAIYRGEIDLESLQQRQQRYRGVRPTRS
jgi:hypothetical protein